MIHDLIKIEIPEPKSREEMVKILNRSPQIFESCKQLQEKAIGKIKVGCMVEAIEYRDDGRECMFNFYGCNIHVSDSFGDTHAERMAIDQALTDRCFPVAIYVTSTSNAENVLLCGSCRHYISEINENCNIVVFNPDGTVKVISNIKEAYPFHKDVKKKNQEFFKYCIGM